MRESPRQRPTSSNDIDAELARSEQALAELGVYATDKAGAGPGQPPRAGGGEVETPEPGVAEEPESEPDSEPADDLAQDSPMASKSADRRRSSKPELTRCERLCELDAAICDLAGHVCGLAEQHPDNDRHVQACARAEVLCDTAAGACLACEEP